MDNTIEKINELNVAYAALDKKLIRALDTTGIEKGIKLAKQFIGEANTLVASLKHALLEHSDNQPVAVVIQKHIDQISIDIDYLRETYCDQV